MNSYAGQGSGGFSLIEFMVSVLLGSILIAGAVGIYVGSQRAFREGEDVAMLADSARFSLSILEDSLRHAGFFGPAGAGDIVQDGDLSAVGDDCVAPGMERARAYNAQAYLFGVEVASGATTALAGCLEDTVAGTDVLVIKHLAPTPAYDADPADPAQPRDGVISFPAALAATETYAIVNAEGGLLFDGADAAPSVLAGETYADGVAYPYRFNIYYVHQERDEEDAAVGEPRLARRILEWDAGAGRMTIRTQELAIGVENMQFLYGLDDDLDGEPDQYSNGELFGPNDWERVVAVRAYLLLRSRPPGEEFDAGYTDNRTYLLGDETVTPADDRRRVLLRTEVTLRNPRLVMRGEA